MAAPVLGFDAPGSNEPSDRIERIVTFMDFVVWTSAKLPRAANLIELKGLEKSFRLSKGVPLRDGFPDGVSFHMNPDFPNDVLLPDSVDNVKDALLVSERLHRFLIAAALPHVEYLPVSILDTHRQTASSTHVIVHPIDPVDCIDLEASEYERSGFVADKLLDVKKLVLDGGRTPMNRPLFRARGLTRAVFVRRDLAQAITSEGFTGIAWLELAHFRS